MAGEGELSVPVKAGGWFIVRGWSANGLGVVERSAGVSGPCVDDVGFDFVVWVEVIANVVVPTAAGEG